MDDSLWTEAETTLLRLKATIKALNLAKESSRLAEVGYKEGVSPQLTVRCPKSKLTSAMLENASAKYNHLIAAALKMAEGTIIKWSGRLSNERQYEQYKVKRADKKTLFIVTAVLSLLPPSGCTAGESNYCLLMLKRHRPHNPPM